MYYLRLLIFTLTHSFICCYSTNVLERTFSITLSNEKRDLASISNWLTPELPRDSWVWMPGLSPGNELGCLEMFLKWASSFLWCWVTCCKVLLSLRWSRLFCQTCFENSTSVVFHRLPANAPASLRYSVKRVLDFVQNPVFGTGLMGVFKPTHQNVLLIFHGLSVRISLIRSSHV